MAGEVASSWARSSLRILLIGILGCVAHGSRPCMASVPGCGIRWQRGSRALVSRALNLTPVRSGALTDSTSGPQQVPGMRLGFILSKRIFDRFRPGVSVSLLSSGALHLCQLAEWWKALER